MRRAWATRFLIAILVTSATARAARTGDDPAAVGARMATHAANAGLKDVGKPIVSATGATCSAGGTIGQIQALFFEIAGTEPNLDVTSVKLRRASDALRAKSVLVEVEYTVELVAAPDENLEKRRWAVPVILNALLGGAVASQGLTIVEGSIGEGIFTLDGRSSNATASKAITSKLDPGPMHLVTVANIDQRTLREVVRDPDPRTPQRAVTTYAFKIDARYDASPVRLDVLKRMAYN